MAERGKFHPVEIYRNARRRVNPEGLAITLPVQPIAIGTIVTMEAGITYAIHELARDADPNILRAAVIGTLGLANITSIALEARALRKKGYGSSPFGSTINIITGKPTASSVIDHAVGNVLLSTPAATVATISTDPGLYFEGVAGTSFAIALWSIPFNALIESGKIDPVVNGIRNVRQSATRGIKRLVGR